MKVSIPGSFKQTLKGVPTKVKASIKKKNSSVDILLESENNSYTCNCFIKLTPALACKADQLKNHTIEGNWETKNVVHRTGRKEKGNSRNLSS